MTYAEYIEKENAAKREKEAERKRIEEADRESWERFERRTRRKNWIEMGCLGLFYFVATVLAIIHFIF